MRDSDINWADIFSKNPGLNPPGYDKTVTELTNPEYISAKKAAALEAAEKKKDKNRKGKSKR